MGMLHGNSRVTGSAVQFNSSVSAMPAHPTRTYATALNSGTADTMVLRWMKTRISPYIVALSAMILCGCEQHNIVSTSMVPTMKPGEKITADYTAYVLARPKRWDVVAFEPPMFTNQLWAMRVVGLPGETVSVSSNGLMVNGVIMSLPVYVTNVSYVSAAAFAQDYVVPKDSYYVLGDNSANANDSRYWGAVPGRNIVGKVKGK